MTNTIGLKNNSADRLLSAFALLFVFAKLSLLGLLAHNSMFVMDEYSHTAHVSLITQGFYLNYFPHKTILDSYFYLPSYLLGSDSAQVMLYARYQGAALAALVVGMIFLIARNMGKTGLEALLSALVLLSFSTFMERAFRVRSEPLSLFFAVCALWFLTRPRLTIGMVFVSGLLSGAAFLTTQKAVYFDVALGLAIIGNGVAQREFKNAAKYAAALFAGWSAAIIAYGIFFRGFDFILVIKHVISAPLRLAIHGGEDYGNLYEFIHMTLARNAPAYGLCLVGALMAIARFKKLSSPERIALIFTIVITFLVFSHNQPWPYIFIMTIPFLALFGADIVNFSPSGSPSLRKIIMGGIILILSISFARNIHYFGHTNLLQNQVSRQAESLLGPRDHYVDGTGMLAKKKFVMKWWDARAIRLIQKSASKGNREEIEMIFSYQPKLWIINYRVKNLWNILAPYIQNSYIRIFPNILISGAKLESESEARFINRWTGIYSLYNSNGGKIGAPFILNGNIVTSPITIKTGEHIVRLVKGENAFYLAPDDINVSFTMPPATNPNSLFQGVYSY